MTTFFVFFQILSFYASAGMNLEQNFADSYKLEINITKIKNNSGQVAIQILDERKKIVKQELVPISDKRCVLAVKGNYPVVTKGMKNGE